MTEFEAVGVLEKASHPPFERCTTQPTIPKQTGLWNLGLMPKSGQTPLPHKRFQVRRCPITRH